MEYRIWILLDRKSQRFHSTGCSADTPFLTALKLTGLNTEAAVHVTNFLHLHIGMLNVNKLTF